MIKQLHLKVPMHPIRQDYYSYYRSKLLAIADGAGKGRGGLPDGWIESGVANYRPYLRGENDDVTDSLTAAVAELMHGVSSELGQTLWLHQIIINRMEPGAMLNWHIDGAPYYHRYHIPIATDGVMFYEGEQRIMMYEGFAYGPISYWLPHKVGNPTLNERVHAIIDFGPELTP